MPTNPQEEGCQRCFFVVWDSKNAIFSIFAEFSHNLECLSLNVRGLNKSIKRRSIFRWLHKQNKDVIFLQETYSSKETTKIWETEWGGKVLYNHGSSHSKGVMILLNPKLDCQIDEEVYDKNRRFLSARITLDDCQIVLSNVYTPNNIKSASTLF